MEHEQLGRLGHSDTGSGETDGRVLTTTKKEKSLHPLRRQLCRSVARFQFRRLPIGYHVLCQTLFGSNARVHMDQVD